MIMTDFFPDLLHPRDRSDDVGYVLDRVRSSRLVSLSPLPLPLSLSSLSRPMGREWALREAHLEIARREKAGLPLISADLIARDSVIASLPADEELRDFDILI